MALDQLNDLDVGKLNQTIMCYAETIYRFNGLWEGPDPLTPLISLFLIQLTFSISFIHFLVFALKPFNQPPLVAEIIGGIILGPSVLGRITPFRKLLFPTYSFKMMEPMAHLSITYFAFLVGLKMDIKAILRTGPKATKLAIAGIIFPFSIGLGIYFVLPIDKPLLAGCLFWGSALTTTGFSVLTKILDKHQILHTEIGKTAASAALITDMCSWGFLAFSLAITSSKTNILWSIVSTVSFALSCVYYVRPALSWIIRKTPEGQGYSEFYICSILTGMSISGVLTDAFGTHPMIGAFLFGLVIPSEVLEATIADKLEDFVVGILMPVYFVVCGLRVNVDVISSQVSFFMVMFLIALACSAKVISSLLISAFSELTFNEAMAVGVLSNAKGVMALIILEAGQIQGVLSTQAYSIMVLSVLIMTVIVTPAALYYKPIQNTVPYKRHTIQMAKSDDELRVLACIYNARNVPTLINLLRTSNATNRSPISVFALQLVELMGRASTMLIAHTSRKAAGPRNPSHVEAQADHIIAAFDNYELRSEGVRTQVYTARCPFTTMDEDICSVAREKRATLILLPFHRQQNMDGEMEDINPSLREVNEGVLAHAPCSVGLLIDRGIVESHNHAKNVAMLYFGGADDREGLAYAWRMTEGTDAKLTVVRFIPSANTFVLAPQEPAERYDVSVEIDCEREKLLDDDYLGKFKTATIESKSISYSELVLNDEEETIKAIKSMDEHKHDLYIVGRGSGMVSPLTSGLADWCDCPELGPIGDLLVTSEFESAFSVVIVQQWVRTNKMREGSISTASEASYGEEVPIRPSVSRSDEFENYGSFKGWDHEN